MNADDAIDLTNSILFNNTSFGSFNGQTFIHPDKETIDGQDKPIASGRLDNALRMVKDKVVEDPNIKIPLEVKKHLPVLIKEGDAIPILAATGYYQRTADGEGLIFCDQYGSPIQTKAGQQFVVNFRDLADTNSAFSDDVTDYTQRNKERFFKEHQIRPEKLAENLNKSLGELSLNTKRLQDIVPSLWQDKWREQK